MLWIFILLLIKTINCEHQQNKIFGMVRITKSINAMFHTQRIQPPKRILHVLSWNTCIVAAKLLQICGKALKGLNMIAISKKSCHSWWSCIMNIRNNITTEKNMDKVNWEISLNIIFLVIFNFFFVIMSWCMVDQKDNLLKVCFSSVATAVEDSRRLNLLSEKKALLCFGLWIDNELW